MADVFLADGEAVRGGGGAIPAELLEEGDPIRGGGGVIAAELLADTDPDSVVGEDLATDDDRAGNGTARSLRSFRAPEPASMGRVGRRVD